MSIDNGVQPPLAETVIPTPVVVDGYTFLRLEFPDVEGFLRMGPRLVSRPTETGDDWELVSESDSVIEIANISLSSSVPRGTGLQLYLAAVKKVQDERQYRYLAARVHSERFIKIMERVHDRVVLLPKDLNNDAEAMRHYGSKEAVAGDYGKGISATEAATFLRSNAEPDGFNLERCIDAFVELI